MPFRLRRRRGPAPRLLLRARPTVEVLEDRLALSATPLGPEFQVDNPGFAFPNRSALVAIASDANGNFVVVWTRQESDTSEFDVLARLYDRDGNPLPGGE